jgi:hypothetical protein
MLSFAKNMFLKGRRIRSTHFVIVNDESVSATIDQELLMQIGEGEMTP